jgi:large subunit ribosomal protein L17
MHRHGYQGRKLSRERDQRIALLRAQATSLVLHEQITTTEAKAKEVAPFFERLVTKAKKGDLPNQRALRAELSSKNAVQKLIHELTPAFADRLGGYTRIVKAGNRRGDNAPMAILALVLPERLADSLESAEAKTADKAKSSSEKPVKADAKKTSVTRKGSAKKEAAK